MVLIPHDYLTNRPHYLLVDEIDKMASKDQVFVLNLMKFATSNNTENLSAPLQSRFFIVELEPYTYEQFFEITRQLISHQKLEKEVANLITSAIWARSQDIRDCIKIGNIAKSREDVDFLVNMFHSQKCK